MRIFLTGATGYVGSAVLDALLRGGHDLVALVRRPDKAEELRQRGVQPVLGDLSKPASYLPAVEDCDALIHTAFERSGQGPPVDRDAIEALLAAAARRTAAGSATTVIYTSGVWVLGSTDGEAAEDAPVRPAGVSAWRPPHEQVVLEAGTRDGVRTVVVRPGIVYGGARGIVGDVLKDALNGLVRVVGDGRNHWSCVYDRDLADLYLRLAESPSATGIFHANDEADERVEDIVDALARHFTTPPDVRHVPIAEAQKKMGPLAEALAMDQIVRSPRARALGWKPTLRSVSGNIARLLDEFRTAREAA